MQPLPGFNFRVFFSVPAPKQLDSSGAIDQAGALAAGVATSPMGIGFAEVSGLNAELEVEEYREGGRNIGARRFPKWGRYPNLVFRRGVTEDARLWKWWADVISHSYTLAASKATLRCNGVILLEDAAHQARAGWFFSNALPERLVGPALNARSNEIAIETLELSHEGLLRLTSTQLPPSA